MCVVQIAYCAPLFIDASADLTRLKIADTNAVGDGKTDCSAASFPMCNFCIIRISFGVTFTGISTFENNTPTAANNIKITSESHDALWKEDHPIAVKPADQKTTTTKK